MNTAITFPLAYILQSAVAFNPAQHLIDQVVEAAQIHYRMPMAAGCAKAVELFRALTLPKPEAIGRCYTQGWSVGPDGTAPDRSPSASGYPCRVGQSGAPSDKIRRALARSPYNKGRDPDDGGRIP